jgi:exonuclease VII small subunit
MKNVYFSQQSFSTEYSFGEKRRVFKEPNKLSKETKAADNLNTREEKENTPISLVDGIKNLLKKALFPSQEEASPELVKSRRNFVKALALTTVFPSIAFAKNNQEQIIEAATSTPENLNKSLEWLKSSGYLVNMLNGISQTRDLGIAIAHFLKTGHFEERDYTNAVTHFLIYSLAESLEGASGDNEHGMTGFKGGVERANHAFAHLWGDLKLLGFVTIGTTLGDQLEITRDEIKEKYRIKNGKEFPKIIHKENVSEAFQTLLEKFSPVSAINFISGGAAAIDANNMITQFAEGYMYNIPLQNIGETLHGALNTLQEKQNPEQQNFLITVENVLDTDLKKVKKSLNPEKVSAELDGILERLQRHNNKNTQDIYNEIEKVINEERDILLNKERWDGLLTLTQSFRFLTNKLGSFLIGDPPNFKLLAQLLEGKLTLEEFLEIQVGAIAGAFHLYSFDLAKSLYLLKKHARTPEESQMLTSAMESLKARQGEYSALEENAKDKNVPFTDFLITLSKNMGKAWITTGGDVKNIFNYEKHDSEKSEITRFRDGVSDHFNGRSKDQSKMIAEAKEKMENTYWATSAFDQLPFPRKVEERKAIAAKYVSKMTRRDKYILAITLSAAGEKEITELIKLSFLPDGIPQNGEKDAKVHLLKELSEELENILNALESGNEDLTYNNESWINILTLIGPPTAVRRFLMKASIIQQFEDFSFKKARQKKLFSTSETLKKFSIGENHFLLQLEYLSSEILHIIKNRVGGGTEEIFALVLLQMVAMPSILPLLLEFINKSIIGKIPEKGEPLPEEVLNNIVTWLVGLMAGSAVADNLVMYLAGSVIMDNFLKNENITREQWVETGRIFKTAISFGSASHAGGPASAPYGDPALNPLQRGWQSIFADTVSQAPNIKHVAPKGFDGKFLHNMLLSATTKIGAEAISSLGEKAIKILKNGENIDTAREEFKTAQKQVTKNVNQVSEEKITSHPLLAGLTKLDKNTFGIVDQVAGGYVNRKKENAKKRRNGRLKNGVTAMKNACNDILEEFNQ